MASNFRLVGQTRLRNAQGQGLENHVSLEVEDGVSRAVADAPKPRPGRIPVESKSPDVARFLKHWVADIHETARYTEMRNRPAFADPKPKDLAPAVELPEHMMVACPACNGEGYYLCTLCDGEGCVTLAKARECRIISQGIPGA